MSNIRSKRFTQTTHGLSGAGVKTMSRILLITLLGAPPLLAANFPDARVTGVHMPDSMLLASAKEERAKGPKSAKRCIHNVQCPIDEYCDKPLGQCDDKGKCTERPEVCTQEYDPVCGCDGQTYSNACVAATAGASIDYLGECEAPGMVVD